MNAVIEPTTIGVHNTVTSEVMSSSSFFNPEPRMMGMESRNAKRVASLRESPRNIPPAIVAPDLENPGNNASD